MFANDLAERRQVVDRAHAALAARHPRGEPQGRDQARRIGAAGAGDIEGGAVIGRGADERQAERDVDAIVEGERLDRDQRLIVIHADRAVVSLARGFVEHGVGRQRPSGVDAFVAQRSRTAGATIALSSVPSEPSSPACGLRPDSASRGRERPKLLLQAVGHDARGRDDQLGRKLRDRLAQRKMDRHRHDGEHRRPQHHHRLRRLAVPGGELGEEFGVAGMAEAGAIQHAFRDGIGHDSAGPSGAHVGHGLPDRGDGRVGAGCIGTAGFCGCRAFPLRRRARHRQMPDAAPAASTSAKGISTPSASARRARKSRSPRT